MAQADKDLNNKKQAIESEESNIQTSADTNSNQTNNAKMDKTIEDAKKSLTVENGSEKSKKDKKDGKTKGLTAYEEQALQGATKSKGNKKLLIILLLLLFVVIVGVAIALFFVLRPEEEDIKAVVCEVEVLSYCIDKSVEPEEYIVNGVGDKFNFTKDTQETSSFTKDIEVTITDTMDFAMTYLVNNVTANNYSYTLDFTSLQFSNCNIEVNVNNGKTYTINNSIKVITISQLGDVVFEVRISGVNPPVYDENDQEGWLEDMQNWANNTWCDGSINLTLEVM